MIHPKTRGSPSILASPTYRTAGGHWYQAGTSLNKGGDEFGTSDPVCKHLQIPPSKRKASTGCEGGHWYQIGAPRGGGAAECGTSKPAHTHKLAEHPPTPSKRKAPPVIRRQGVIGTKCGSHLTHTPKPYFIKFGNLRETIRCRPLGCTRIRLLLNCCKEAGTNLVPVSGQPGNAALAKITTICQ